MEESYRKFILHIFNDRPEWYVPNTWLPKSLITTAYVEYSKDDVNTRECLRHLTNYGLYKCICADEKRARFRGSKGSVRLFLTRDFNIPFPAPRAPRIHPIEHRIQIPAERMPMHTRDKGWLYIIKEREFIRLGESTYKIGKTIVGNRRFKKYPKESVVYIMTHCANVHVKERTLIDLFKKKFTHMPRYGAEYFSGDVEKMMFMLLNVAIS